MLRTPIWATASLLAVAISLAGCGEDKTPANQTAAPQSTTESVPAEKAQAPDDMAVALALAAETKPDRRGCASDPVAAELYIL